MRHALLIILKRKDKREEIIDKRTKKVAQMRLFLFGGVGETC